MNLDPNEALALWWSGEQLIGHSVLGVPVLWLSRGGKVLSLLSGLVIVYDIIGPRRFRDIARSLIDEDHPESSRSREAVAVLTVGAVAAVVVSGLAALAAILGEDLWFSPALAIFAMVVGTLSLVSVMPRLLSGVLADPSLGHRIKRGAAYLLCVGFLLDLLAS
jgi:hypothetical protein